MRDLIEEELARSRMMIADGVELVPRFRMRAEDGDTMLYAQLPVDHKARVEVLDLVKAYMAVKLVRSFVMASEMIDPDCSMVIAVSHGGTEAAMQMIHRNPLSIGSMEWLSDVDVADEIPSMLPPKMGNVSSEQIALVNHLVKHDEGLRLESL